MYIHLLDSQEVAGDVHERCWSRQTALFPVAYLPRFSSTYLYINKPGHGETVRSKARSDWLHHEQEGRKNSRITKLEFWEGRLRCQCSAWQLQFFQTLFSRITSATHQRIWRRHFLGWTGTFLRLLPMILWKRTYTFLSDHTMFWFYYCCISTHTIPFCICHTIYQTVIKTHTRLKFFFLFVCKPFCVPLKLGMFFKIIFKGNATMK